MKFKNIIGIGIALLFAACDKSLDVEAIPDLKVTTEKTTYQVGEEINFQIEGNPDMLSFYSGEVGNDYEYLDGRIVPAGELTLSFSSKIFYGLRSPGQLSVLVSTDFTESYTIEGIKEANWTDITDRLVLPENQAEDFVSSGDVDISDLAEDSERMFFAFKYRFDPEKDQGIAWRVNSFSVTNENLFGLRTLMTQADALFALYYEGPKEEGRSLTNRASMTLKANADKKDYTEDWNVSAGIQVGSTDLGPDKPIIIKGTSGERKDAFQYTFSEPGNYTVRFIATNATIKESKTSMEEMEIEVVP